MRTPVILSAALLCILLPSPREAAACSLVWNDDLVSDPAFADDDIAPGATTVEEVVVHRSEDSGCAASSCGDLASIQITVAADDDRAPADRLGYHLTLASGTLPRGLTLPPEPIVPGGGPGRIVLFFSPDVDSLDFELSIRAVDLNGNHGAPAIARVVDRTSGGCSAPGGRSRPWSLVGLLLVLGLALRRRSRP
jgi:MYXO-CTERM domain-containing protein